MAALFLIENGGNPDVFRGSFGPEGERVYFALNPVTPCKHPLKMQVQDHLALTDCDNAIHISRALSIPIPLPAGAGFIRGGPRD